MTDNLEKIIESAKRTSLTTDEKADMRLFLLREINKTPIKSPFWSYLHITKYTLAPAMLAVVIFVGGGASYFAQNSLPGESLYSMKINVNEKVESLLASTPEDLAEISAVQANRRIIEAEVLAQNNLLTPERNIEIQDMFSKKFDLVNETLAKLEIEDVDDSSSAPEIATMSLSVQSEDTAKSVKTSKSFKNSRASEIRAKFEIELDDHEVILQKLSEKSSTSPAKGILTFLKNKRGKGDNSIFFNATSARSKVSDDSKNEIEDSDDDDESENEDEDEDYDDDRSQSSTTPAVINPPKTATSTTIKPSTAPVVTSYTITDVAKHNTATNCWSVVSGVVYNLTTWIAGHPGGEQAIKGMCGVDATAAFMSQHQGETKPEAKLATFKIGVLK